MLVHDRRRPYPRSWAQRAVVASLAAVLGLLSACTASNAGPADPIQFFAAADRKTAPELAGQLLDGSGAYDPATYAGQILVINFWASWCPPCVAEASELEAVYAEHKDEGVAFLGINVNDQTDSARAFARQHTTYPSIEDPSSKLTLGFNVHPRAIPATIILDRQGRVAAVAQGAVWQVDLDPVIAQLLGEAT